ncbi:MAG: hypothetical protein PVI57_05660 [Gemmatimonadota bacterium]|jgi:hypothetical protein
MTGVSTVAADGRPILLDPLLDPGLDGAAPATNAIVAPRELRRELLSGGRSVIETVLLSGRFPAAVVQWTAGPGEPTPLSLGFRLPGDVVVHRRRGGMLRADGAGGPIRLIHVSPPPTEWSLGADGRVRMRVPAPPGMPVTLLAAQADDHAGAAAALAAVARARVVERRAGAAASAPGAVALHSGVPELDEPLRWAIARLDGGPPAPSEALRCALLALGRAAAGLHRRAREAVEGIAPDDPWALVARAWVAGWTGWPGRWAPDEVRRRAGGLLPATRSGSVEKRVLARAAVAAAGDVLDALGDRPGAGRLRAALPAAPVEGLAGLQHPLATALGVPISPTGPTHVRPGPDPAGPAVPAGLDAWALFAAGRPEEGHPRLRQYLARAFADATGCWRRAPGSTDLDDPAAAALVPVLLLHGVLGARPDAPFGRLRLAPALPAHRTRFDVTGIRLGGSVLELSCRVREGRHTFVLRPTAGRVPTTLVFEPSVAGPVESVEVDGATAEVAPERGGGRTRVSLQIPLDQERRVTLVGTDG